MKLHLISFNHKNTFYNKNSKIMYILNFKAGFRLRVLDFQLTGENISIHLC